MWFITLAILALAAFLVVKALKAQSNRKTDSAAGSSQAPGSQDHLERDPAPQDLAGQQAAANDSQQPNTRPEDALSGDLQAPATGDQKPTDSQQDDLREIREMIKALNLADVDSGRLGISAEQFNALRTDESAGVNTADLPSRDTQADVADRLRRMLA